jgi:hypothetical protein
MSTRHDDRENPPSADSAEKLRAIARHEAISVSLEHEKECQNAGPVCKVWEAIDVLREADKKLGAEMGTIREEQAEARGAQKQQARNLAIVVAVFGAVNVIVALAGLLLKLRGQ